MLCWYSFGSSRRQSLSQRFGYWRKERGVTTWRQLSPRTVLPPPETLMVTVTQILPEGKTQSVVVNPANVEQVNPKESGSTLIMASGRLVDIKETMDEWTQLAKRD
jgi:hypothetical protein